MRETQNCRTSFFLGANTPAGFYSLFDELYDPLDGWRLYIIKGGPGTGKSTLMRAVADEADRRGLYNERIFCSSDPKSLDGVILPSLKISVADGTAPHVLEPVYPGAVERTVDLGLYRDDEKLGVHRAEIVALTLENKARHLCCARYLAAAAAGLREAGTLTLAAADLEKADAFADRLSGRVLGTQSGEGRISRRFLSAVTPEGIFTHAGSVAAFAEHTVKITDRTGALSSRILSRFVGNAVKRGYHVTVCPSFLFPETGVEAALLPELSFALLSHTPLSRDLPPCEKTVRADRFLDKAALSAVRNRMAVAEKAAARFLKEAVAAQTEAKALHDKLEAYYVDAMDFDAAEREKRRLLSEVFG